MTNPDLRMFSLSGNPGQGLTRGIPNSNFEKFGKFYVGMKWPEDAKLGASI